DSLISKKIAITRAMPNMAALVGKSITCLCHNRLVKEKHAVQRIFSSIGEVMEIEERHMDAVTAVAGSGPAYFFYLAESLRDAAVKMGIKKDKAARLAVVTLVGSGALLENLEHTVEALRERITSKRGTTEAALNVLKTKAMKNLVIEAAKAAAKRSKEISKGV
ncbi:pyrroline-5-carboxylate reductase family protein, partial [Candidatus Omnitrophota bacterium]